MKQQKKAPAQPIEACQHLQKMWEKNWQSTDYSPSWVTAEIPKEIQQAVLEPWFIPGSKVLDIGCGSGEIAIWLATCGFKVTGVDFSASAIQKAQENAIEQQNSQLQFAVRDMCLARASEPQFNTLIDRGCLQGLPKMLQADYVKTVASWALPGAHFLLIFGFGQGGRKSTEEEQQVQKQTQNHLETLLKPYFNILQMESTVLERRSTYYAVPAVAVRMTRHH